MENNSQAIEVKGIVRNQTKIGVQDGQCDDLVNLRFKDGSWRVADDGKVMLDADNGQPFNVSGYSQLYVHTNVYHHLLGVKQGKLYWFANIGADGESFTNLDNPVEICDVQGEVTIVQNGHLLTIISTAEERIRYSIFITGTNEYRKLIVNANGEQTDRGLFPFGKVHLNFSQGDSIIKYTETAINCTNGATNNPFDPAENKINAEFTIDYCKDKTKTIFSEQTENNRFTRPFLAIVAVKLYDGSYMYASAPIFLNPNERVNQIKSVTCFKSIGYKYEDNAPRTDGHPSFETSISTISQHKDNPYVCVPITKAGKGVENASKLYDYSVFVGGGTKNENYNKWLCDVYKAEHEPIYSAGAHFKETQIATVRQLFRLLGFNLVVSLGDLQTITDNRDVFKAVSIFITKQSDIFDYEEDGELSYKWISAYDFYEYYKPYEKKVDEIIYDLIHSPFYLLREYNITDLKTMSNTSIEVDLSAPRFKGLLANIEKQPTLNSEVFSRNEFIPKVVYQYNRKLHIANYKTMQFHGYPIDCFHLSNHNVKVEEGGYAVGGMLPNLIDGSDVQYLREKMYFAESSEAHHTIEEIAEYVSSAKKQETFFASITTTIETSQGEQKVIRYIAPYNANYRSAGMHNEPATFLESLGALLTYPDYRAKEMLVEVVRLRENDVTKYYKTFELNPHPYINISYYIDKDLKPIRLYDFDKMTIRLDDFLAGDKNIDSFKVKPEQNITEDFPAGLRVTLADNPFFFPYETTYQVGSLEIVALMSNAVAVGTGQTGAAPLYVFCKDGIYSLMVDSSGEMIYTNARIIARDVCNNAKSVTPIDSGVVFTTDRGLMSIAGSEVVEIGSAAEGDVFDITDTSDKAKKIMFNAFTMPQLAEFPQSLIDNTDFLTYLKGAIVNYNHNERELMVSNPDKDYTYVMDRNGNWSKRAFTAKEYVNNYPTSYRIDNAGNFYKVDADDDDTNKVYLLSNIIKLGTIAFKQAYRLVVRGYFETEDNTKLGLYVFGSYDGRQWALLGGNERDENYQSGKFTDIGCKISHTDIRFLRICLAGKLSKNSRIDYIEVSLDGSMLNGKLR